MCHLEPPTPHVMGMAAQMDIQSHKRFAKVQPKHTDTNSLSNKLLIFNAFSKQSTKNYYEDVNNFVLIGRIFKFTNKIPFVIV